MVRCKVNLSKKRFGRLTALKAVKHRGKLKWRCKCDCGNWHHVLTGHLNNGSARSCGCLRDEINRGNSHGRTHGLSKTNTYTVWQQMRARCHNAKNPHYNRYGGRGITVCGRWDNYSNFLADMGSKPKGKSLDRIDNDGIYEPSNCRWATQKEQMRNISRNVHIEICGAKMTVAEASEKYGISYTTLFYRLQKMSPEKAVTIEKHARKY